MHEFYTLTMYVGIVWDLAIIERILIASLYNSEQSSASSKRIPEVRHFYVLGSYFV